MIVIPFRTIQPREDRVSDYIRSRLREESFHRRLMPPVEIDNVEFGVEIGAAILDNRAVARADFS